MVGDREMEQQKRRLRTLAKGPIILAILSPLSPASPYPQIFGTSCRKPLRRYLFSRRTPGDLRVSCFEFGFVCFGFRISCFDFPFKLLPSTP